MVTIDGPISIHFEYLSNFLGLITNIFSYETIVSISRVMYLTLLWVIAWTTQGFNTHTRSGKDTLKEDGNFTTCSHGLLVITARTPISVCQIVSGGSLETVSGDRSVRLLLTRFRRSDRWYLISFFNCIIAVCVRNTLRIAKACGSYSRCCSSRLDRWCRGRASHPGAGTGREPKIKYCGR